VAGVVTETQGEIAIFDTRRGGALSSPPSTSSSSLDYQLLFRVENNPYDVLGDWCGEHHFLAGRIEEDDNFGAVVVMCEAVPGRQLSLDQPAGEEVVRNVVVRFRDVGTSYLRCLIGKAEGEKPRCSSLKRWLEPV
jgi:hypothetical protein